MAFVYSCCFWFSLRLGGILIAIFSLFQASMLLIACIIAQANSIHFQETLSSWINNFQVQYSKAYLENIRDDPDKFLSILITLTCIYILLCLLYIYGAYTFHNYLMAGFILIEFIRLLILSVVVSTWLLILKQNTMDIGLLICASVVSGFALLGMFYLWVCLINLPILINEMEREKQAATIAKLQQLLENNQKREMRFNNNLDDLNVTEYGLNRSKSKDIFVVPNNYHLNSTKNIMFTNNITSRFVPPQIDSYHPLGYSNMLQR